MVDGQMFHKMMKIIFSSLQAIHILPQRERLRDLGLETEPKSKSEHSDASWLVFIQTLCLFMSSQQSGGWGGGRGGMLGEVLCFCVCALSVTVCVRVC